VLAANSRTAEQSLRAATLRSEREQELAPKIGPQVNLTSLGSLAANLVGSGACSIMAAARANAPLLWPTSEVAAWGGGGVGGVGASWRKTTNNRVSTALKTDITKRDRGGAIPPR